MTKEFISRLDGKTPNKYFPAEPDDPIRKWDILRIKPEFIREYTLPLWGGLRFVGIWPLWHLHEYKFVWTSLEHTQDSLACTLHTQDQHLRWIYLKEDVFASLIQGAETAEQFRVGVQFAEHFEHR